MSDVAEEYKEFYSKLLEIQSDFLNNYYVDMFSKLDNDSLNELFKTYMVIKNQNINSYVYIMFNSVTKLYKIGTSTNPLQRMQTINSVFKTQFGISNSIILVGLIYVPFDNAYNIEKKIHNLFQDFRVNGEWFSLNREQINGLFSSRFIHKIVGDESMEPYYYYYDNDGTPLVSNDFKLPDKESLYTFALDTLDNYTLRLSENNSQKATILKKYIHSILCNGKPKGFLVYDMRTINIPFSVIGDNIMWEIFKWIYLNSHTILPALKSYYLFSKDENEFIFYEEYIRKLLRKDGYYDAVTE